MLAQHLAQEAYVARQPGTTTALPVNGLESVRAAYEKPRLATDLPTLLAFFYGDKAVEQLGPRPPGSLPPGSLPPGAGFRLARMLTAEALT